MRSSSVRRPRGGSSTAGSRTVTPSGAGDRHFRDLGPLSLDRQGMHPLGEFRTEHLIDGAVGCEPAFAGKGGCGDPDPEMRLAALLPAPMAGMIGAFVEHFELRRVERGA